MAGLARRDEGTRRLELVCTAYQPVLGRSPPPGLDGGRWHRPASLYKAPPTYTDHVSFMLHEAAVPGRLRVQLPQEFFANTDKIHMQRHELTGVRSHLRRDYWFHHCRSLLEISNSHSHEAIPWTSPSVADIVEEILDRVIVRSFEKIMAGVMVR